MKLPPRMTRVLAAIPAAAQQVVFHDGFETGLSNWTATGLWNLEDCERSVRRSGRHPSSRARRPRGSDSGGAVQLRGLGPGLGPSGTLAMNAWVTCPTRRRSACASGRGATPSTAGDAMGRPQRDRRGAERTERGLHAAPVLGHGRNDLLLPWHERRIDLSAYRGASVRVHIPIRTRTMRASTPGSDG